MSSNTVRKVHKLLDAVSAAGASAVLATDHKFKEVNERCFAGTLTTGDTITIQVKLDPDDATWFTHSSHTDTSFSGLILGPWPFIRVNKTGTNGAATVFVQG